jgi:probable rRNA maturation factor
MSVAIVGPPLAGPGARLDVALLRKRSQRVLRALGRARDELTLCLVDDDGIAALNRSYRGRPRPTDVLSFSLLEGDHEQHRGRLLGDVVISVDTAARQARDRHRALDEVAARLLIHGVLHIVGHDHERAEEARAMRAEERRLWRALHE